MIKVYVIMETMDYIDTSYENINSIYLNEYCANKELARLDNEEDELLSSEDDPYAPCKYYKLEDHYVKDAE